MKKIYSLFVITLAFLLIFASCGAKNFATEDGYMEISQSSGAIKNGFYADTVENEKIVYDGDYDYAIEETPSEDISLNTSRSQRKIIYTSSYKIQTEEFNSAKEMLDALCEKYGAYYEEANISGTEEKANRRAYYTIRIPVENYFEFRNETGNIGVIVRSSENNRDVSEQYFDTEARLESAKLREERLLEILKTAKTLDDVLSLERELPDVRYEIESMSGTLRKYDSLISYSTITVEIEEVIEPVEIKNVPKTFGQRMIRAITGGFEDFVDSLEDFAVELTYSLPQIIIFIVFVFILVLIIKKLIKKHKNKKASVLKEEKQDAE